jgi:hypothetical protein
VARDHPAGFVKSIPLGLGLGLISHTIEHVFRALTDRPDHRKLPMHVVAVLCTVRKPALFHNSMFGAFVEHTNHARPLLWEVDHFHKLSWTLPYTPPPYPSPYPSLYPSPYPSPPRRSLLKAQCYHNHDIIADDFLLSNLG